MKSKLKNLMFQQFMNKKERVICIGFLNDGQSEVYLICFVVCGALA